MMKNRTLLKLRLVLCAIVVGVLGQNCQDARIEKSVGAFASGGDLLVKMADIPYTHRRYVFFVDMSGSMISGPCPNDIDGGDVPTSTVQAECVPSAAMQVGQYQNGNPVRTYQGSDPQMHRLVAIENWMASLNVLSAEERANVKVAIVPFTGGFLEEARRVREGGRAKWRDLSAAATYVSTLKGEQQAELQKALDPNDWTTIMGTSAPVSRLGEAYELIRSDMIDLADKGAIATTAYQFIYLSDGVPTPIRLMVQKAVELSGCGNTAAPYTCDAVTQELKEAWGDPDTNTLEAVKAEIDRIQSLTKFYGEVDLTYSLVVVHPERILPANRTKEANLLYGLREKSNRFQLTQLDSGLPPFVLKGLPRPNVIYRVTAFHAYNLNARLNSAGQVSSDTDGDGLFDYEEAALGTDPLNPRTDGVCLDSIATNPAYKAVCKAYHDAFLAKTLACNPELDIDRDGLNECEEEIVGTDPFDFDSDDDSVPDGLEIIYRMFPNKDDSVIDSNSDGTSNLVNFERGLMPNALIGSTDPKFLVNLNKRYSGSKSFTLDDGRAVESEIFNVDLLGAPIMRTGGAAKDSRLFGGRAMPPESLLTHGDMILAGTLNPEVNEIIFLARVVEVDDPTRSRWLMKKAYVRVGQSVSIRTELGEMKMMPTMDHLR